MKLPHLLTRCLLPLVVIGLLAPLTTHAAEDIPPQVIKFAGKFTLDEAWLGNYEKLAAAVTEALKNPDFATEFKEFSSDKNRDALVFDKDKEEFLPEGRVNSYVNAKYGKVASLLKSNGVTPYQYCATNGVLEIYFHLRSAAAGGDPLPDNKRIRDNVAFCALNAERILKAADVLR